jgi:hypothetical protein
MQTKTRFSLHYLEHRLADHPERAEDPGPAFEALRRLWLRATDPGEGKRFVANKVAFARSICPS